jgi:hypothetical protein
MDAKTLLAGMAYRAEQLAVPLAQPRRWQHENFRTANARIVELENALGKAPGPKIFNMTLANRRIEELEGLLAAKIASTNAAAPVIPLPGAVTGRAQSLVEQCLAQACTTGEMDRALIGKLSGIERMDLIRKASTEPVRKKKEVAKLKSLLPECSGATKKMLEAKIARLEEGC